MSEYINISVCESECVRMLVHVIDLMCKYN